MIRHFTEILTKIVPIYAENIDESGEIMPIC
jgi:hypothetical protein